MWARFTVSRISCFLLATTVAVAGVVSGCSEGVVTPAEESPRAPALEREGLDGNRLTLERFRGKVVLLNFWATWCPYCQKEIPHLVDLQESLGDKGLQVVGAALNWKFNSQKPGDPEVFRDKVGAFVMEEGLNYPVPLVAEGMKPMLDRFGNTSGGAIPYTVVIDREGRIRATFLGNPGAAKLRRAVKALL